MLESFTIFAVTATSIVLEAAPFLIIGSLIAACVEMFASPEKLSTWMPRSAAGQIAVGLFAGMLLPTCECGIVPVARKLLLKGVPPRAAVPYMMAAPVINPVVIASTLFAYQGEILVPILRCALVLVPAVGIAMVLGDSRPQDVLRQRPLDLKAFSDLEQAHIDSHSDGCACGCSAPAPNRFLGVLFHTTSEFLSMARFLILGAVAAAGFKTFLPVEIFEFIASSALLSVAGLMLLAVLLSVCSEADAFVAASFSSFPLASQIGFMALGPLVDLKLIPMFFHVFNRRIAVTLIIVPVISIFFMAMLLAAGEGIL